MTTPTTYIGSRPPLAELFGKELLPCETTAVQVIDVVGASPPPFSQITDLADANMPTVILSVRRYNLADELSSIENRLMTWLDSALIFRTTPIDRSIEMYWGWASATGILLSAFYSNGTAWVHTKDIAEAVQNMDASIIRERNGRAFDITGPTCIPMEKLREDFSAAFNTPITLECGTEETIAPILMRTGVPRDVAKWLTWYQSSVSDPRLPSTTTVLSAVLGRAPHCAHLVPDPTDSEGK